MRSVGSTAFAGMSVATARLARSAYNIANVNTPRFEAQQELQHETPDGAVASYPTALSGSFRVHNFQGQTAGSNTDIGFEAVQQISAVQSFKANVAMLQADDERYGTLLNLKI